jgi:hypothetical protein
MAVELAVHNLQIGHFGIVQNANAGAFGRGIVGIHHRLAAAQEECVRASKMKGAAHGVLKPDALLFHPLGAGRRSANRAPQQRLVGLASRHAKNVVEKLVFRVRVSKNLGRRIVHGPQVSGVPAIAAAKVLGRAFQHQHACSLFAGAERCRQSSIAATYNENINVKLF